MITKEWLQAHQKPIATVLLIALIAIAFSLFANFSAKKEVAEQSPLVLSTIVKVNGADQNAIYSGEVRGRYESSLAFQVGGKVIRRNVELGSNVNAGDVLMEIDPKDVQQSVNISSAQVAAAQSQLALAETNLKRYRTLYEQNAVSRAIYDQYENAYAAAVAAANQASAQNVQGSNQLGYTALRATSAGVISSISVEAGQVVAAGQSVLTLVQDGEREIEMEVPENRYEEIRNAREIKVSFWALPDRIIDGTVREISPIADKTSRTYKVRIHLTNPPQELKLGMTASVNTAVAVRRQSAYVPLSAIYQTGVNPSVWVVSNDIATLRPVKLGAFGDGTVQVLEGLNNNEVIITAGVHKLKEGQKVRLAGEEK
ncbi:MAG TPA: efflux RND transporter periplasmic adaptor subunit [Negativicutes bacterium]|nr:efflux RND transporter periplasmic adaptor subunit [Negativicutes bacterium]